MILIIAVLFITGFFFPPAWLGLAGYAIYMFASRHSRRDSAVEQRIRSILKGGTHNAIFPDLYFEAARSYAVARGGVVYPDTPDAISANTVIDGRIHSVTFVRDARGTYIAITER